MWKADMRRSRTGSSALMPKLGGDYASLAAEAAKVHRLGASREQIQNSTQQQDLDDPRLRPEILRYGYDIDSLEGTTYYSAGAYWTRATFEVAIRPVNDTAKYYAFQAGHSDDQRPGVMRIEEGQNCRLAYLDESDKGVLTAAIEFDPDDRDQMGRCIFSWTVHSSSTVPAVRTEEISGSKTYLRRLAWRVQFTEPAMPRKIWWFRDMSSLRTDLSPSQDRLLKLNTTGYYSREFLDVEDELCGLVWRWDRFSAARALLLLLYMWIKTFYSNNTLLSYR